MSTTFAFHRGKLLCTSQDAQLEVCIYRGEGAAKNRAKVLFFTFCKGEYLTYSPGVYLGKHRSKKGAAHRNLDLSPEYSLSHARRIVRAVLQGTRPRPSLPA